MFARPTRALHEGTKGAEFRQRNVTKLTQEFAMLTAVEAVPSITSQSNEDANHLPIGQLQFVVFRRDLVGDAPDLVAVRVVAQVKRALTFNSASKPRVTKIEDSWVVRGNSYQMRVAPVPDNPEMILVKPEHAEFIFPAGRYALVLKNVAYDFTLDGPITDTAHCLERTDV